LEKRANEFRRLWVAEQSDTRVITFARDSGAIRDRDRLVFLEANPVVLALVPDDVSGPQPIFRPIALVVPEKGYIEISLPEAIGKIRGDPHRLVVGERVALKVQSPPYTLKAVS
jgi:hypothetical protein